MGTINTYITQIMANENKSTQTSQKDTEKKVKKVSSKKLKLHFGAYIPRIQKKVDSSTRLSLKALVTMDGITNEVMLKLSEIMSELVRKVGKKTVQESDVKAAIKLLCHDGEISKHMVVEGSKASMKLKSNK